MKIKKKYNKLALEERLYQYDKPIIALTGGIATGKSTVTKLLEKRGLSIIDADLLVKSIYETPQAKEFIQKNYPFAWSDQTIDFKKLRELVFTNSEVKNNIEAFIYQRLPSAFKEATLKVKNQDFYLYDVPLLFERGLDNQVDLTIVVYAPRKVQQARLIDRDGTNQETANKILNQQMDIEEKKEKADFTINNFGSLLDLEAEVEHLLREILET